MVSTSITGFSSNFTLPLAVDGCASVAVEEAGGCCGGTGGGVGSVAAAVLA